MEHFIRIAFWIAFFCLTKSVSSFPTPKKEDFRIKSMRDEIKCESDSMFYAPENVKEECITAALECIQKELNGTVKLECVDTNHRIDQAVESFDLLIKRNKTTPAPTDSRECVCETWSQTSFSEFLNKIETLIENAYTIRTQTT